jgi:hypothetical protein
MPGRTVADQARYTVAAAFAEVRDGMDAPPLAADFELANRLSYVLVEETPDEFIVQVAGAAADIEAYEAALEIIR